jgi:hypothetical protein
LHLLLSALLRFATETAGVRLVQRLLGARMAERI